VIKFSELPAAIEVTERLLVTTAMLYTLVMLIEPTNALLALLKDDNRDVAQSSLPVVFLEVYWCASRERHPNMQTFKRHRDDSVSTITRELKLQMQRIYLLTVLSMASSLAGT